jgi:hypothetical protein
MTMSSAKKPPPNLIQPVKNPVKWYKRLPTTTRMAGPLPVVQVHRIKNWANANPLEDLSHLNCGSGRRWSIFWANCVAI